MSKPFVYIASPYTSGDAAMNTHFQCKVFDRMLTDGRVWPIAPLWSHFQHTLFPRPYNDWLEYDKAVLARCDACIRLGAELPELNYREFASSGADCEVEWFRQYGKPVFFSIDELYDWIGVQDQLRDGREGAIRASS